MALKVGLLHYFHNTPADNIYKNLDPLISIKQSELVEKFLELDSFIGSTQLISHIKTKILGQKHIFQCRIFFK